MIGLAVITRVLILCDEGGFKNTEELEMESPVLHSYSTRQLLPSQGMVTIHCNRGKTVVRTGDFVHILTKISNFDQRVKI